MVLSCIATQKDSGRRAVDVLIRHTGMSHYLGKKIRLYGNLEVNGRFQRMIDPVRAGDQIRAIYVADGELPEGARLRNTAGIQICFQDDWLLVVDKPPHMLTHPAFNGQHDSLTTLLSEYNLHPVNRLDRGTSGLIVLARNGHAHHILGKEKMSKEYLGLVHGRPKSETGSVDLPIARMKDSIILREINADGKPSLTRYATERTFSLPTRADNIPICSLLRFSLETGRTHQIRVHCAALGTPLIGDGLYGHAERIEGADNPQVVRLLEKQIDRQALHACRLAFSHPITKEPLEIRSMMPSDMVRLTRTAERLSQRTESAITP
ncbi:MAG: RluA family pseudouridine synthase [Fastidiosipilaceae bacterium]|jgi:23S rRNA pseudouridine1911/1915/1917 synthase